MAYLQRARILAETVRRHHPDWTLWVCISDKPPAGFDLSILEKSFDHVIWVEELPVDAMASWIFKHNVVELCTAVKGYVLDHILEQGADAVVYIDPDIALFSPLVEVVESLKSSSVILTPHLIDCETTVSAILENERSALMHGVYNLGFLAVRNDDIGRRFARWWRDRLSLFSYEEASRGIYTDQRWCDLVPAFFDNVKIMRHAGYNVASWNISQRPLQFDRTGCLLAKGVPLRFYHFTKIDHVGELMIEIYAGQSKAIFELVEWYRAAMQRNESSTIPKRWWFYGNYDDGAPIPYEHRLTYRRDPSYFERYKNPYVHSTFRAWLEQTGQA